MLQRTHILTSTIAAATLTCVFALQAQPPVQVPVQQDKNDNRKQFPFNRQKQDSAVLIPNQKVVPLMHKKLDHAKDLLEGLALEDHKKIGASARAMKLLSLEAGWNVVQTEEYMQQSRDFRRTCDLIEKAAKAEDVNRAALSYVSMTVRCVDCHSYLRDNKIVLTSKRD